MVKFTTIRMPFFKILSFPCEVGFKRHVVHNRREFAKYFNATNKFSVHGAHNSVYSFSEFHANGKPVYASANVDKIIVDVDLKDFDYDDLRCYLNAMSIHEFCSVYDLQHVDVKSGNGFHFYIGVDSTGIPNDEKDQYIVAAVNLVSSITGVRTCESSSIQATKGMIRSIGSLYTKPPKKKIHDTFKIDEKVNPLIATIKEKRDAFLKANGFERRFCTSIDDNTVHSGWKNIIATSTKQSFYIHEQGHRRIVLSSLKPKPKTLKTQYIDEMENGFDELDDKGMSMTNIFDFLENCGIMRDEIAPCIKIMIKEKNMGYVKRFFLVVYLDSLNLTRNEIKKALSLILSNEKFHHAYDADQENDKPGWIIEKRHGGKDYNITCGSMQRLGYCMKTCNFTNILPF